jgi:hypothetical protein
MGVRSGNQPPQRSAGKALGLDLAASRGQRHERRRPENLRVIAIGNDHPAALRQERRGIERRAVQLRRESPVEAVAIVQIVGPFRVAQQIGAAHLDLDDGDPALGVDAHQIGAASAAQRHFGQAPGIVAREQPADSARDGIRAPLLARGWGGEHGETGIRFDHPPAVSRGGDRT